ncbi:MAG TPA: hypothetical protein PLY23_07525 [Alphaproteobacteria bacterium]|nr:hypothetical protein [Alphaproteobacteria bacterium]HQS94547.1 hypothetical protein [Alphaproteobacteria bacterium]
MTSRLMMYVLLSLCMSGCTSLEDPPRGIGYDMDALKESACPCGDIFYQNGVRV